MDVELLQLFVASLEDADCTRTLFSNAYARNSNEAGRSDKVKQICDLLAEQIKNQEKLMNTQEFEQIYTVLLSCFVKPTPGRVVEALLDLKKHSDKCKFNTIFKI
jgi:galactose-1-phosphate uridylyltransferase